MINMENIVTSPVYMARLWNQKHVFTFQERNSIYMLSDLDSIESEHCDIVQAMNMANGEIDGFNASEYVEPVYTFTVRSQIALTKEERVVKSNEANC